MYLYGGTSVLATEVIFGVSYHFEKKITFLTTTEAVHHVLFFQVSAHYLMSSVRRYPLTISRNLVQGTMVNTTI